jgi:hypothetical protein
MFVADLFCGWIKARQAAGADPDQTAALLSAWMDDDPYGFCSGLEKDVAGVLSKAGLASLVAQVRARFGNTLGLAEPPAGRWQVVARDPGRWPGA